MKTTEFLKGTSLETLESQTQPDKVNERVGKCAQVVRRWETVAVFEPMAELAVIPTQSIFTHEIDDDGDDVTLVGHVAQSFILGAEGDGSPQGSPKTIHSAKKTTEDPMANTAGK